MEEEVRDYSPKIIANLIAQAFFFVVSMRLSLAMFVKAYNDDYPSFFSIGGGAFMFLLGTTLLITTVRLHIRRRDSKGIDYIWNSWIYVMYLGEHSFFKKLLYFLPFLPIYFGICLSLFGLALGNAIEPTTADAIVRPVSIDWAIPLLLIGLLVLSIGLVSGYFMWYTGKWKSYETADDIVSKRHL